MKNRYENNNEEDQMIFEKLANPKVSKQNGKGDKECPACTVRTQALSFAGGDILPHDLLEMGRSGWTLLHSVAAYYPEQPTVNQTSHAVQLVESVAQLFPCHACAEDMQHYVAAHPVRASNRQELSIWMCEAHNHVNQQLDRESFECTLSALDKRWRNF